MKSGSGKADSNGGTGSARVALHYPVAPRGNVVDEYHGRAVPDPYRWLEDLDSPQTTAWVRAQTRLAGDYLAGISKRSAIEARLAALYDFQRIGVPFQENGRYFYTSHDRRQNQGMLLTIAALDGTPAVVVDPNTFPAIEHRVVSGYATNRTATLIAYGVSEAGSDWTDWHIRDIATGRDLADVLRFTKYYRPIFTPDGKGLYYSAFPAPRAGAELEVQDLGHAVYYHALGTASSTDRCVLGHHDHPDWQYDPHLSPDGRWLIVVAGEGQVGDKRRENLYLVDLAATSQTVITVAPGFEASYVYVGADAARLYFLTSLNAPNGRVVAIDPANSARHNWQEVIPEGRDAIDLSGRGVTLVGHRLIVRTMHDVHSRAAIHALDGTFEREIVLPGVGTAIGFGGHPDDRETFYAFTDLVTPPTVYRYDLESHTSTVFHAPAVPFDPSAFEQRQVFYPGRDGTRIPMLLAYHRGVDLTADNPTLLCGYGGFGQAVLPAFNPSTIAWLEMGGVFAIANIRGGGEYGEAWHRQGTRTSKQVVFDDFLAAAEWLIANNYTSASRLAIMGRSNGGLLVGACLTQRPDLFGAAIALAGVLDMLRFNCFGQGAGWEGDYGSPQNREEFEALYAYSPVHNVRTGNYPATLVVTGDHDTRVMPMHSFKFTAALQVAQMGSTPILLSVIPSSGHGGGETRSLAIAQSADIFAFLVENLAFQNERQPLPNQTAVGTKAR